jgi:2-keto-4-pentenoate hydratase/2-oxohepta-3-ene-1,7-dioic acid hydratase in catechol pathway
VVLTGDRVDFEVELVVAIGRRGRRIGQAQASDHVAGYCVGQDISDRALQFADRPPQFSLGKSADTYGPIGPAVVSPDGLPDPDDLSIRCEVSGETMQEDRTSGMIFSVSELLEYLSRYCTLEPGDLVFTGTPAGVGSVREPRRYLKPGDVITSSIEGVGALRNRCLGA